MNVKVAVLVADFDNPRKFSYSLSLSESEIKMLYKAKDGKKNHLVDTVFAYTDKYIDVKGLKCSVQGVGKCCHPVVTTASLLWFSPNNTIYDYRIPCCKMSQCSIKVRENISTYAHTHKFCLVSPIHDTMVSYQD
mgnify:CR=1 FL=1|tara:strand:+ start:41 stop:445 length:405 start_codon:yes stop_codon:yes gene_type:complete